MPRRSAASFQVVELSTATRLEPPRNLTKTERELFVHIVNAIDPKHFARSDAPLLGRYVKNLCLADIASGHLEKEGAVDSETGKANPWMAISEKADRAIGALATRLRLCPSARFDQATAHRRSQQVKQISAYDQMHDDVA